MKAEFIKQRQDGEGLTMSNLDYSEDLEWERELFEEQKRSRRLKQPVNLTSTIEQYLRAAL